MKLYNVLFKGIIDGCWTKSGFYVETLDQAIVRFETDFWPKENIGLNKADFIEMEVVVNEPTT